jgi:uncharacterized protein YdiU (UPF0061 family)
MFEDIISLESENIQLRLDLEKLTEEKELLENAFLYSQNERVKMVFAFRELKILRDEYREALEKEAWELIEKQADKKFAEWVKKYHDIEQVKVEATLRP